MTVPQRTPVSQVRRLSHPSLGTIPSSRVDHFLTVAGDPEPHG
jgi:hypothetical protein